MERGNLLLALLMLSTGALCWWVAYVTSGVGYAIYSFLAIPAGALLLARRVKMGAYLTAAAGLSLVVSAMLRLAGVKGWSGPTGIALGAALFLWGLATLAKLRASERQQPP